MKILITILLALFISNNVFSANLQDLCNDFKEQSLFHYDRMSYASDKTLTETDVKTRNVLIKMYDKGFENLKEYSKVYHYLDCGEVLK